MPGTSIRDNLVKVKEAVFDNIESSDESEVENEEGVEVKKKLVSRLNKLTKTERNAKLLRKLRHEEQEYQR